MAPYIYNGPYWVNVLTEFDADASLCNTFLPQIGFDNTDSMALKAQWVNSLELGGVMVWSIEADDFRGDYGEVYPLVNTLKRIMNRCSIAYLL